MFPQKMRRRRRRKKKKRKEKKKDLSLWVVGIKGQHFSAFRKSGVGGSTFGGQRLTADSALRAIRQRVASGDTDTYTRALLPACSRGWGHSSRARRPRRRRSRRQRRPRRRMRARPAITLDHRTRPPRSQSRGPSSKAAHTAPHPPPPLAPTFVVRNPVWPVGSLAPQAHRFSLPLSSALPTWAFPYNKNQATRALVFHKSTESFKTTRGG